MAGNNTKEIKTRIKTVQNTQKVTHSMKLLSTIKLQQFMKQISQSKHYTKQLNSLMSKIAGRSYDISDKYVQQFFKSPESSSSVCLVVISSDKGLCGGYNNTIFKFLEKQIANFQSQDKSVELIVIGKKAIRYAEKYLSCPIIEKFEGSSIPDDLHSIIQKLYSSQKYQQINIVYSHFISSIKSNVQMIDLLPLKQPSPSKTQLLNEELIIEPSITEILSNLIPLYISNQLSATLQRANASEMAQRVLAMTAATDNAKKLIEDLTLQFNKARQSAITQEISEIVVGVESMKS